MFSIIIPVYNLEECVERCIESILQQNYNDFEIIIVNDGSTDKSKDICTRYAASDQRIRLINIFNSGLSVARNVGMRYASKEYVIFIDGDDFVDQSFLKTMSSVVKDNRYPDIVAFNFRYFDTKTGEYVNSTEMVHDCKCTGIEYLEMVLQNKRIYSWYVWRYAYRKDFYTNHSFEFTPSIHYEDIEFMFKVILKAENVVAISNVYYNYVINRKGSITGSYRIKSEIDKQKVISSNKIYILNNTTDKIQKLLLKNLFVIYSSSLHVLYFYKGKEFHLLLHEIEKNKDMCRYAVGTLDMLLSQMIKKLGIKRTAYILYIRAKIVGKN